MNNENIMNNENVEAVVEAVKATKVEKAGAIALVVFATVGVAYTVSKGYQLGKKAIAKYLPKIGRAHV